MTESEPTESPVHADPIGSMKGALSLLWRLLVDLVYRFWLTTRTQDHPPQSPSVSKQELSTNIKESEPMESPVQADLCNNIESLKSTRSLLWRLPVDIVRHFWAVALSDEVKPLEFLDKCLTLVPEISHSIAIVTDDIQRYKSSPRLPQAPPLTDLNVFILEIASYRRQNGASDIWRILVLFNCEGAVRTGELTASDGCPYARVLFDPCIDLAYCFIHCNDGGHTEQLVKALQNHRRSSRKLRVERVDISSETRQLECRTRLSSQLLSYHSYLMINTGFASQFSYFEPPQWWLETLVDLRMYFPDYCTSDERRDNCNFPSISITPQTNTPQLHVTFKTSRIPCITATSPVLKPLSTRSNINDFAESHFSLSNLNWSLATPHGALCKHTDRMGYHDQEELSRHIIGSRNFQISPGYTKVHYYGIPDIVINVSCLTSAEEFVWHRLTPIGLNSSAESDFYPIKKHSPLLKRLVIFSELNPNDMGGLGGASFRTTSSLDYLQLVALEGSSESWNINKVYHVPMFPYLAGAVKFVELLQLYSRTELPRRPSDWMEINWRNINLMAIVPKVERLVIGGYLTAFILPENISPSSRVRFYLLKLLCLDVTPLNSPEASDQNGWYSIVIPDKLFPRLERLYLRGFFSIAMNNLGLYPKISVPKTCATVDLSSVIRTKVRLNNKEMEIPEIPIVADTFNSWHLSKVTGEFQYNGAATSTMKRLEEVDEALRPV